MNASVKSVVFWVVIMISAVALWRAVKSGESQQAAPEISYSQFLSQVEAGNVVKVTISGNAVQGSYRNRGFFQVIAPPNQDAMVQTLRQKNVEIWYKNSAKAGTPEQLLATWAPLVLLAALWFFMIRQMKAKQPPPATDSTPPTMDARWPR